MKICKEFYYLQYGDMHDVIGGNSHKLMCHYNDVIMSVVGSQITSLTIVYSTVYSGSGERKHQSSTSLPFVWEIHQWLVNSPHKWSVTWKMFPSDDVITVYGMI